MERKWSISLQFSRPCEIIHLLHPRLYTLSKVLKLKFRIPVIFITNNLNKYKQTVAYKEGEYISVKKLIPWESMSYGILLYMFLKWKNI